MKKIDPKKSKALRNARYYRKTAGTPRGEINERNKRKNKTKNFILKEATKDELLFFKEIIDSKLN